MPAAHDVPRTEPVPPILGELIPFLDAAIIVFGFEAETLYAIDRFQYYSAAFLAFFSNYGLGLVSDWKLRARRVLPAFG